jgi:dipeptidyl aminopeptidase/acylaminoacyl peptidase
MKVALLGLLALSLLSIPGVTAPRISIEKDAVREDPLAAQQPPASMEEIRVLSHGARMNGLIYLPGGAGPHPIVLFLHGYPGNERNLDIAQAVRRAGFAAMYFDYRGAFGSGGTFTFAHTLEDVAAALAWIRNGKNATKYRIDPARIAVFGHSFGGWLALASVAHEPAGVCVAAPAAWNPGWVAQRFGAHPEELAEVLAYYQATTNANSGPIKANPYALITEMHDHAQDWDYDSQSSALKDHALLLIAGTSDTADEGVERETQLANEIRAKGGKRVQMVTFEDDESFSSHRLALADAIVQWLRSDCERSQTARTDKL